MSTVTGPLRARQNVINGLLDRLGGFWISMSAKGHRSAQLAISANTPITKSYNVNTKNPSILKTVSNEITPASVLQCDTAVIHTTFHQMLTSNQSHIQEHRRLGTNLAYTNWFDLAHVRTVDYPKCICYNLSVSPIFSTRFVLFYSSPSSCVRCPQNVRSTDSSNVYACQYNLSTYVG